MTKKNTPKNAPIRKKMHQNTKNIRINTYLHKMTNTKR